MLLTTDTPRCYLYKVWLNGEDVTTSLCIEEANEEAGYLLCFETQGNHRVIKDGEPVKYMLRGIVKVELQA